MRYANDVKKRKRHLDASFRDIFYFAVDKGMLILGNNGRRATYFHLEKTFNIKREDWYRHPEKFAEAIQKMFGPGAEYLLKAITANLYSRLGLRFDESEDFQFKRYIRRAKMMFRGMGRCAREGNKDEEG